jgi:hypothetical protein
MNWRRIVIFMLILFLATAAAAFPFGFIRGYAQASGRFVPSWVGVGQALVVPLAGAVVVALLAKRQITRPWEHAWAAVLGAWLLTLPINVMLLGQAPRQWLGGLIPSCLIVILGVPLGLYLRERRGSNT